ncbi:uncharacterized protein LOC111278843 [Durio zibethinus]|uniref:Uncharacterized protein LOC111278843 n=1 Tax=Durio zibethinus TaxID=66656 RepID=A0A6P5WZA0_DURZI|nr:uncharacterized protein LOC111278843 [Durio zibethinus]
MARFSVLFTVIFLLFTFSHARFFTAETEHEVNPEESIIDLPESDPKTTTAILLPSERPGFEPAKIVDFKHDDASETDSDVEFIPLTTISFHPVNRHFPRRPLIPFRHKHNCRFHKRFRPLNPRLQQKHRISYGDDMILSDGGTGFDPESRWPRFPDDATESKEHVDFLKPHHHDHEYDHEHDHDHDNHHHYHRRHHHGEEDESDEEEEHEHEHEGGFMRRLSKFFIHV